MEHSDAVVDQFTRQAAQFAHSPAARNEEIVERILRMAQAGPADTALDVASGPGVLACALARLVRHATGIDLTPAMLDQARAIQADAGLTNLQWDLGDVTAMPYAAGSFTIVTCRFAFHHFPEPLQVLREMRRVAAPGARIVVADSAPAAAMAAAFNAMEKLRDPSHTRAMPAEELRALFTAVGLPEPRLEQTRLALDLDSFLARSYPPGGERDKDRLRAMFEDALADHALDVQPRREAGIILFSIPVAILAAQVPDAG
ncbi:MAG TPA: methyltransferase domain-containing protein [Acidobacteriaceae bacterium]|jgi:ubiquinone/menaquinone biosynthesis C-methylase UbiE|nr:methyltransferase domain-containing protein [Acidobacteriaceae bacterium]